MALKTENITIDTTDPQKLAEWWARALDGQVNPVAPPFFVVVSVPGESPGLAFQKVDDPTPGKNRVHVDFSTPDMEADVERLVSLGATETGRGNFGDFEWVVLADPVERAAATPEHPQPFRELGLKDDEYERIREILGRRPTDAELAMYSVMWSEHCSYKSSKVHLRYFGETTTDAMRAAMLAGIGENAGVVDIGDGWAATFKVESHNHPSYIEPYQGAATGVGGIVRDIMAMGARPVAVMDQLRFGAADAPDTRRVVDGVVRGVGGYGNSLGLPNIGGETVFDESYAGNPLVNALCAGT